TLYDAKIVNHAHNDYLESLAETGIVGGLCCAWFLGVLVVSTLRFLNAEGNSFPNILRLCGWTACCGLLVHSLVDFNLHIPSNLLLFLLMSLLGTAVIPAPGSKASGQRRKLRAKRQEETAA